MTKFVVEVTKTKQTVNELGIPAGDTHTIKVSGETKGEVSELLEDAKKSFIVDKEAK